MCLMLKKNNNKTKQKHKDYKLSAMISGMLLGGSLPIKFMSDGKFSLDIKPETSAKD